MERIAEVIFVASLTVQVAKLGDFVLRPRQQKAVQGFFDSLALRLDEIEPIKWLRLTESAQWRRWFFIVASGLFIAYTGVTVYEWIDGAASAGGLILVPGFLSAAFFSSIWSPNRNLDVQRGGCISLC